MLLDVRVLLVLAKLQGCMCPSVDADPSALLGVVRHLGGEHGARLKWGTHRCPHLLAGCI
eukprot:7792578-Pyramimonas_sp.AAC.1